MPLRQRGTKLQAYSPEVLLSIPGGPRQRSIYPPPAQTLPRQYPTRPGRGRGYPVSQPGALRQNLGRGVPISKPLPMGGSYQATHIGYDLQGEPMFGEQPNKMQRLEDEYKVCHVG